MGSSRVRRRCGGGSHDGLVPLQEETLEGLLSSARWRHRKKVVIGKLGRELPLEPNQIIP